MEFVYHRLLENSFFSLRTVNGNGLLVPQNEEKSIKKVVPKRLLVLVVSDVEFHSSFAITTGSL